MNSHEALRQSLLKASWNFYLPSQHFHVTPLDDAHGSGLAIKDLGLGLRLALYQGQVTVIDGQEPRRPYLAMAQKYPLSLTYPVRISQHARTTLEKNPHLEKELVRALENEMRRRRERMIWQDSQDKARKAMQRMKKERIEERSTQLRAKAKAHSV